MTTPPLTPALLKKLQVAGFETPGDCLWHVPIGYEDRTRVIPLKSLKIGEYTYFCGHVCQSEIVEYPRRMLKCLLEENGAFVMLRFFYFHAGQARQFQVGVRVACFGEIRFVGGYKEVAHPNYQILGAAEPAPLSEVLWPIYPKRVGFGDQKLREVIQMILAHTLASQGFQELLNPESMRILPLALQNMTALGALQILHAPTQIDPVLRESARVRLAFEELIAHQLSVRVAKRAEGAQAPCFLELSPQIAALKAALPFQLTQAQVRVAGEILQDLKRSQPMHRLLQGDVGSGKTVMAWMAALQVIHGGYQVALMAPTEILAEQHAQTAQRYLAPLGIAIRSLKSKMPVKLKREVYQEIAAGTAQLVIGTHALFQERVEFAQLGLVIMDEQHRFGVRQRKALLDKSFGQSLDQKDAQAHQLLISATPIPRTLAMTLYGDLDISTLDELPAGRTPIKTALISGSKRSEVMAQVKKAIAAHRQVYWVCPLIETSEVLTCQAAEAIFEALCTQLEGCQLGLIHGRLDPEVKQAVMRAFATGKTDLLVATSVIEVGVDVPNASIMIIENPERMGLAQLHQLRGRVGRGEVESFCVLLYEPGLSQVAFKRLEMLRHETNGFSIADEDLRLRGPGQWLGTQQTGALVFLMADLSQDAHLLEPAKWVAERLFQAQAPQIPDLIARWVKTGMGFSRV